MAHLNEELKLACEMFWGSAYFWPYFAVIAVPCMFRIRTLSVFWGGSVCGLSRQFQILS